mgnify:CR=1 FL=1
MLFILAVVFGLGVKFGEFKNRYFDREAYGHSKMMRGWDRGYSMMGSLKGYEDVLRGCGYWNAIVPTSTIQ